MEMRLVRQVPDAAPTSRTPRALRYIRPSIYISSMLGLGLAGTMMIPMLVGLADADASAPAFAWSSSAVAIVSALGIAAFRGTIPAFTPRFGFMVTTLLWLASAAMGAVPFLLLPLHLTVSEAYFESMSGLTTTGATVLTGLDMMPRSILLWRSMLQWFGGIGIIAIGLFLFPFLRVGGMQFFRTESSDKSDKAFPRLVQVTRALLVLYVSLTVLSVIVFAALGMTVFDAINHAMTTLSTGGFSTHDRSFGFFESSPILWAGTVFMLAGSLPFLLYVEAFARGRFTLFRDLQVRVFLAGAAAYALVLAVWLGLTRDVPFLTAITQSAFNVTSIITTTGYASDDYTLWGPFAFGAFFILTFFGGCSGSTTGGIKIYRFIIICRALSNTFTNLLYPAAVVPLHYGGRKVDQEVFDAVVIFVVACFAILAISTLLLSLSGEDLVTALSGSLTAFTNVGPGLGDIIGPAGNFERLNDFETWLLSVVMLLGRLEIMTVLVLFTPAYWH